MSSGKSKELGIKGHWHHKSLCPMRQQEPKWFKLPPAGKGTTKKALTKAGNSIDDVDYFEV